MITIEGDKVLYKIEYIKATYKEKYYTVLYYTKNYCYSVKYCDNYKIEYYKRYYLSMSLEIHSASTFLIYNTVYTYD